MTPFMPEKYQNPAGEQNDVEMKNVLAVKTVKAHGVEWIDDLYTAVTDVPISSRHPPISGRFVRDDCCDTSNRRCAGVWSGL